MASSPAKVRSIAIRARVAACISCLSAAVATAPSPAWAQDEPAPQWTDEVARTSASAEDSVVDVARVPERISDAPVAIGVVDKDDVQRARQQLGLDESLVKIPGIFMQNRFNAAQDLRISIRGSGARAPFGIRGVKILVDGIPETLPDGQGQVDSIDLGAAERIEVVRGASSSLYGNASGGVINVITEDPPPRPFVETRLALGEYGFGRAQVKAGGARGPLGYSVSVSRLTYDGFREHSRTENRQLSGKLRIRIDDSSELATLVNFTDSPIAEDPGSLTLVDVEGDRTQANPANLLFDAGEQVTQGRLGLAYHNRLLEGHELSATGFYTFRDFSNALPFQAGGKVDFDRLVLGGGVKYVATASLAGRRNRLIAGVDLEYQSDDRRQFDNDDGQTGALALNQMEEVTTVAPFLQYELSLRVDLELTAGARYDRIQFGVADLFLADGDDSGARTLDQLSPMAGIVYRPHPLVNLYGNVATSFETPTTTELADPSGGGGFNASLDPQTSISREIGSRGNFDHRVTYQLAVFDIDVRDELLPFELPELPGRTFFRNAGRSSRRGIEVALGVHPVSGLAISTTYTYSDFSFDEYRTEQGVFDGNDIPASPEHLIHAEIGYLHRTGLYGAWELSYVDGFFADDANTARNQSYVLSNLRAGYLAKLGDWRFSPFVGLNNLFDQSYNHNVRTNAFGGRYYEPAPGFNVHGGTSAAYLF